MTPGPGSYRSPSEFGQYQAQEKYIREFEKADGQRNSVSDSSKTRTNASHHTAGLKSTLASAMNRSIPVSNGRRNKSSSIESDAQTITKTTD